MLDDVDVKILDILQRNGRTRRADLAEAVGFSLPSISDRLRKLEGQGIITGYHATLDPKKLGRDITAFIVVTIDSSRHYQQFLEHAGAHEEILECHAITGDGTHLLKVRTANTASLERLLGRLQAWAGVTRTHTSVVLSTSKESTYLPVETVKQEK